MPEPLTMTNDEAQDWLLAQHNAAPGPPDPARFGAAIRAIRAKAIADAKEWFGPEPTPDALRTALQVKSEAYHAEFITDAGSHFATAWTNCTAETCRYDRELLAALPPEAPSEPETGL